MFKNKIKQPGKIRDLNLVSEQWYEEDGLFYKVQVYNRVMRTSTPPQWFTNWSNDFEKRINTRFDILEAKVEENTKAIQKNASVLRKHFPEDFK